MYRELFPDEGQPEQRRPYQRGSSPLPVQHPEDLARAKRVEEFRKLGPTHVWRGGVDETRLHVLPDGSAITDEGGLWPPEEVERLAALGRVKPI